MDKSVLGSIADCVTRIGIHRRLIRGYNFISKILKELLIQDHFLIKTQDYNLQRRILLNSVADDFV